MLCFIIWLLLNFTISFSFNKVQPTGEITAYSCFRNNLALLSRPYKKHFLFCDIVYVYQVKYTLCFLVRPNCIRFKIIPVKFF